MEQLPVFIRLGGQKVLLVGGGAVAERKLRLLEQTGARLTVVAPELTPALAELREAGRFRHIAAGFEDRYLVDQRLVVAATDDKALNRHIARTADSAGILCNAVDDYEASRFTLPAIVDRSPVIVAVGTGGRSPVLARNIKSLIERTLPTRIGELAKQAGRWRGLVSKRFASLAERRYFWQRFFDGPSAAAILANRMDDAVELFRRSLLRPVAERTLPLGEAFIVGAGPGDPGLVTLRAQQLIGEADVVLYDRLVSRPILDFARKEADLVAVGKSSGRSAVTQPEINRLLVKLVRDGKRVCRLKGGDPFIFGRGGEEAEALARAGLRYQIVPGVSAALGCAAYAGVPLTFRGVSRSVTLATASLDGDALADWSALARPDQTLALYMSVGVLEHATAELQCHGLGAETPAAIVENGTTGDQRVIHATLATIAAEARAADVRAPAVLFVGESVALGKKLSWFGGNSRAERFDPIAGVNVDYARYSASG